jgi:hypothetical protein
VERDPPTEEQEISMTVNPPAAPTSPLSSIVEEAQETRDVTRKEAAKGDRVAQRKLAAEEAAQASSGATETPPAANGRLNVVA